MAENLTRQILREHLAEGELSPGEAISLHVDQTLLHADQVTLYEAERPAWLPTTV